MTKSIGGYFELELRKGEHYHKDAICLNTARNCFEYILLAHHYKKVYIPYYTCEVMLQPLQKHHIAYEFYHIGLDLEPIDIKSLKPDEAYLYTNNFGLKQACVEKLAIIYGSQLIVDNAQAFYAPRVEGIDTFYSPRKFFGVPDGGYLYTDQKFYINLPQDHSINRMRHLLVRIEDGAEAGYTEFQNADNSLDNKSFLRMSCLTSSILANIDYAYVSQVRRTNFCFLHQHLEKSNQFSLNNLSENEVPMVYPYYCKGGEDLKAYLIKNKVFVATYWTNVKKWCEVNDWEYLLAQDFVFLPIDQRYNEEDCKSIIKLLEYGF